MRSGETTPMFVETLEFNPVTKQNSGEYVCSAENSIGVSNLEKTNVRVLCKYYFFGQPSISNISILLENL